MDRMLVVVRDDESKACEGKKARFVSWKEKAASACTGMPYLRKTQMAAQA
jgi:hypothetical protein